MAEDEKTLIARRPRRDPYRLVGETFGGRYRLEEFAGMGSFGAVYRAADTRVGRTVAVKILKPDLGDDETAVARELFQREALTAGRLMHPHIVAVTDVGEESDFAYLVMEWLEGHTLEDELRARVPFTPEEIAALLAPISDALQTAHDAGVIHRDIKPSNIYIGRRDRPLVKVLDFGIAKVVTSSTAVAASRIAGTVSYMSPEQITGSRIDRRTDIYSLGIVLYQMLTGELPFKGESQGHIIQQHIAVQPPSLAEARPDIPPALSQVIGRALGKLPEARQQSAHELNSEFNAALSSKAAPQSAQQRISSREQRTEVMPHELPPTVWDGHFAAPPPLPNLGQPTMPVTGSTKDNLPAPAFPTATAETVTTELARQEKVVAPKSATIFLFALAGAIVFPLLSVLAFRVIFHDWYFTELPKFTYMLFSIVLFGLLFGITASALRWSKCALYFALGGAGALLLLTFLIPLLMTVDWEFSERYRFRYFLLHNMLAGALLGLAACALRSATRITLRLKAHLLCGASCAIILILSYYLYQLTNFSNLMRAADYYLEEGKFRTWLACAAIGFIIGIIICGPRISYKERVR
ncbi:MAG: eukaryotic-like serine/threonine-protein kinase [Acidobacteriota bacterium]|jgi:serine/threonine protein kinase|nr:eukaryotic-like serine/threonine-protein kinase [Acidobacteriota bacterium]